MPAIIDILKLKEDRAQKLAEARSILERAEKESRSLTSDEKLQWDKAMKDVSDLKDRADNAERQEQMEREIAANREHREERRDEKRTYEDANMQRRSEAAYEKAWAKYMTRGLHGITQDEYRALQADVDASGGYTVLPTKLTESITKALDNVVKIRTLATIYPMVKAASLGVMKLDADPSDAEWTTELLTGSQDTAMAFGRRDLSPQAVAKRIKISNKLINLSTVGIENFVKERLVYKYGVTQEKAFLTGTGSGQPLGVYVASANGISTGRDVSTGNTTTAITIDGLINAKMSIPAQYRNQPSFSWNFHRDTVKMIMKLKDTTNQYLLQPVVRAGEPDTILGHSYFESEYAPNTYTAGLYVGILGDWKYYAIAESLEYKIQRLVELYAETNEIGYIARMELDAAPILEGAFARVKLAAA